MILLQELTVQNQARPVCYNITFWHQCVNKPLENTSIFNLTLWIYIQIPSKWWKETVYAQSTMESRAQMDGKYKHPVIGMTNQHAGMRGRVYRTCAGRRPRQGKARFGGLWEQSHRYCLAMQRWAKGWPSLLRYNSLQFVNPWLMFAAVRARFKFEFNIETHLKRTKAQCSLQGLWFGLARQLRIIYVDYIIERYTMEQGEVIRLSSGNKWGNDIDIYNIYGHRSRGLCMCVPRGLLAGVRDQCLLEILKGWRHLDVLAFLQFLLTLD